MRMRKNMPEEELPPPDPTGWIISNSLAHFLLLHTHEIKYMAMFGYTFLHGCKLYKTMNPSASKSFKFIFMILQCTGGGLLVPIFINTIPVALAQDAYPIAIMTSFLLHEYYPILRDILDLSNILKTAIIVLYETLRASVVVKFTVAAASAIAPSDFGSIALFGPIFCGAVSGCGGAFLPLSKGLNPLEESGLTPPMWTALAASSFYHLFVNTSLSANTKQANEKAHVLIALFFILYHLYTDFPDARSKVKTTSKTPAVKVESKKNK